MLVSYNLVGDKRQILVTPDEYAEAARAALDDGYDAIKVDPLKSIVMAMTVFFRIKIVTIQDCYWPIN